MIRELPTSAAPDQPATLQRDRWDQALLIGGALGLLINLLGAALLGSLALFSALGGDGQDGLYPAIQAASFVAVGALGLPAMYWGAVGRRRRGVERPWPAWILALLLFPLALGLGRLAFEAGVFPGALGAVAHVVAAGSPVLFVASIVLQRGGLVSGRRRWGHFLAGLWGSPPLSLLGEVVALIPAGIALFFAAALSPEISNNLKSLVGGDLSDEAQMLELATNLMSEPAVALVVVGYLSVLVPMIEEVFKTLAIWPVLRGPLTRGQAFLGGALGGAGYALFESLFLPQPGEDWLVTMLARTGTPLIHAFNTGLVSLGLMMAVRQRKWARLPLLYGLAVVLHGLWNFLALGIGLSGYGIEPELGLAGALPLTGPGLAAAAGLIGLAGLSFAGLIWLPGKLD